MITLAEILIISILSFPLYLFLFDYLQDNKLRVKSMFLTVAGLFTIDKLIISGFFGLTGLFAIIALVVVGIILMSALDYINPPVKKGVESDPIIGTNYWNFIRVFVRRPGHALAQLNTYRDTNKQWANISDALNSHYTNAFPDCLECITMANEKSKSSADTYTGYNISLFQPTMPYNQTCTRYDKFDQHSKDLVAAVIKNNANIYNELKEQFPDIQRFGSPDQTFGFNFYVTGKDLFLIEMRKGKITLAGQQCFLTKAVDFYQVYQEEQMHQKVILLHHTGFDDAAIESALNVTIQTK